MYVIVFNGSPCPDGNTSSLIQIFFEQMEQAGIYTEMFPLMEILFEDAAVVTNVRKKSLVVFLMILSMTGLKKWPVLLK